MTAWQRSNITTRHEKGIGAVSFKRLLMAGGAGALVALVGGRIVGFFPSCLGAGVVLAVVLTITHPVEGMPLFAFGLRSLRGLATAAAVHGGTESPSLLGRALQVTPEDGVLQADAVFDTTWAEEAKDDLDTDYEYLGRFADAQREGMAAIDNPFQARGDVS